MRFRSTLFAMCVVTLTACTETVYVEYDCTKPLPIPPDRPVLSPVSINQNQTITLRGAEFQQTIRYFTEMDKWADDVLKREAICEK